MFGKTKTIKESPFLNKYGGLDLIEVNGTKLLRMENYMSCDLFSLTKEQEEAFHLLCDVVEVTVERGEIRKLI